MSEFRQENDREQRNRDRRIFERYGLENPKGSLKYNGDKTPCDIVDVSLGGCCIRTETRFVAGNLAQVQVEMPIHGMLLRMAGITQWTSRNNLVGIRFIHPSQRSKNELAGLLTCLVDKSAADVVAAAVVAAAAAPSSEQALNLEIPKSLIESLKPSKAQDETPEPPGPAASPLHSENPGCSDGCAEPKQEKDKPSILPAPVLSAAVLSPQPQPQKKSFPWAYRS
jgi:hypothetical protein